LIVNLGDAYHALGQTEKATATYQQAISVGYKQLQTNPQDVPVLAQIALSYAKVGNPRESESLIRRARAQDNKDMTIAYIEVLINALNGKQSQALSLLAAALENHFPAEYAANDPDLESLRSNPEFAKLIKKYAIKKP
jgi:tetratricopeptide (TPR) repeat protein